MISGLPIGIYLNKYKLFVSLLFSGILLLTLAPSAFAASVSITSSPSSVQITSEFTVGFTASGVDPSSSYYIKARVGQSGTYTYGETKNGDNWLRDTSSWSSFPTLTSDSGGVMSGSIIARAKSTATVGDNTLIIRTRKVGNYTNIDSTGVTINLTAAPTPTPSPTPSLSPTLSPTPVVAATASPAVSPTPTPTPKPSAMPTKTPTSSPSPEMSIEPVLSANTESTPEPSITPEAQVQKAKVAGISPLALGLVVAGIGLLGFSGYSLLRPKSAKIIKFEEANHTKIS